VKQYYIGLASTCHDPAIAILDADGQVLFAEALERYLQHKRAWDAMPDNMLYITELIKRYCDPSGKFIVATSWSRRVYGLMTLYYLSGRLSQRRLSNSRTGKPSLFMMDSYAMDWVSSLMFSNLRKAGTNLIGQLRHHFGNTRVSLSHFHHHRCHAAYACYSSPFEEGACAIIDGLGEFGSHSFYAYRKGARTRP
jgi:carbamoyltransferase